jgi:hypothetical protein
MKKEIDIPEFNSENGLTYSWEDNFKIKIIVEDNSVKICANQEGLISLANHLLNLAQDKVPVGYHMHFDEYNSLEEESSELIIEKE